MKELQGTFTCLICNKPASPDNSSRTFYCTNCGTRLQYADSKIQVSAKSKRKSNITGLSLLLVVTLGTLLSITHQGMKNDKKVSNENNNNNISEFKPIIENQGYSRNQITQFINDDKYDVAEQALSEYINSYRYDSLLNIFSSNSVDLLRKFEYLCFDCSQFQLSLRENIISYRNPDDKTVFIDITILSDGTITIQYE